MAESRVLVVAAHPDDEILGAGGTVANHVAAGDDVRILLLSEGERSRSADPALPAKSVEELRRCALTAARCVGADLTMGTLPDNAFDTVALLDIVRLVEAELSLVGPDIVYTHHVGDLNIDHELTCRAVLTATRPAGEPRPDVLSFEVCSSTDWAGGLGTAPAFRPTVWQELDERSCDAKRQALAAYEGEMRPWPHSRSIEAVETLWRHRGSQVGLPAAEAFMLLRSVRRA